MAHACTRNRQIFVFKTSPIIQSEFQDIQDCTVSQTKLNKRTNKSLRAEDVAQLVECLSIVCLGGGNLS